MTITEAKQRLELPALLHREGLGAHAKKSARCPFHDDQHNSFSIYKNGSGDWRWKCFSQCGTGDEINFLEKLRGISSRDATKLFIEMAAGPNGSTPTAKKSRAKHSKPFDWQACVDAFTDEHLERLADWRGYSGELCSWLKQNKLVGLYDSSIAFPVHASSGAVVGCHYRVKQTGRWKYAPEGSVKVAPLVVGPINGQVHLFESQWDAFAFRGMFDKDAAPTVIATRGVSNGLPASTIPADVAVFAWKQNDKPGEEWLRRIIETFPQAHTPIIPAAHKDLNDWTRAGLQGIDLMIAIKESEERATKRPSADKLFNEIKSFLFRYVVFSNDAHPVAIALWVMHTWVVDCADYTPYIFLHSPVMRCGKTRLQEVVEPLVMNPLRTSNISESVLFREIEKSKCTLIWDETDSVFGGRKQAEANESKRSLLNAGFQRGATAIREKRVGDSWVSERFDPFCPKILAGIGRLPETIIDRSISILIHRKLKTQHCQKYRRRDRALALPIHEKLKAWSADAQLLRALEASNPQMPEGLNDRQEDIWEPLLAIADAIGGDLSDLARSAARTLCDNVDEDGYGPVQLAAIRKVVGDSGRITSQDLIDSLWEADALPSYLLEGDTPNYKKIGHWLSKFIKMYGGKPSRNLDFGGKKSKGYEASELNEIFARYCPE
jgi:hypothetical protein